MKTAYIEIGDTHTNSTVALCPPKINLDDGGTYHASRFQRWLLEGFQDFTSWAKDMSEGYRRTVDLNGDMGELDTKRRSNQLITPNKATILGMVIEVLSPLVDIADSVFVKRGTPAHTGKSGWLEEAIGKDFGAVQSKKDVYSHWHLRLLADKVRIDSAHHAAMPSLPWTEKNAANKIAAVAAWRYAIDMKQPLPHLMFRSHNHRWSDSFDNYPIRAICLPCWSLLTEYGYRIGAENGVADIGGAVVLCDGDKYEVHKFRHEPMKGRIWQIQA